MQALIYITKYENGVVREEIDKRAFVPDTGEQELNIINIYPEIKYQDIEGFGGAITEAVGHTLHKMSEKNVEKVLADCFGENGLGYQMIRTHLDSCDFSLCNYSAAKTMEDIMEGTLSFAHDEKYIVPYIKKAIEIRGGQLKVMLTPWSPPDFMKTNGERNNGGKLKKEYYSRWAEYIANYIKQYKEWGILIDKLSIQNEPNAVQFWDSCIFTAQEEKEFLSEHLYPVLKREGLSEVGIYIWDHNKERMFDRAAAIIDASTEHMVEGVAFHWYSGDHFEAVKLVSDGFPSQKLLFSEGCIEYSKFDGENQLHNAQMYAHDMIGNFNNGMHAFIDWNILLNENGGQNHAHNYCEAPIICDTRDDSIHKKLSYYYIRHFSHYIKKGAKRVAITRFTDEIEVLATENPDGKLVVVILNRRGHSQEIYIRVKTELMYVEIQGNSISTILI